MECHGLEFSGVLFITRDWDKLQATMFCARPRVFVLSGLRVPRSGTCPFPAPTPGTQTRELAMRKVWLQPARQVSATAHAVALWGEDASTPGRDPGSDLVSRVKGP
jgi:hypothetical protein